MFSEMSLGRERSNVLAQVLVPPFTCFSHPGVCMAIFLADFFHVMHGTLSERGTTHSLAFYLSKVQNLCLTEFKLQLNM